MRLLVQQLTAKRLDQAKSGACADPTLHSGHITAKIQKSSYSIKIVLHLLQTF